MFNRRSVLTASVAIPAVALAASCSGLNLNNLPAEWQTIVDDIQQGAAKACAFLPSVKSILALIGGVVPIAGTAAAAIDMICSALVTPPLTFGAPRVGAPAKLTVKGVTVTGIFVR